MGLSHKQTVAWSVLAGLAITRDEHDDSFASPKVLIVSNMELQAGLAKAIEKQQLEEEGGLKRVHIRLFTDPIMSCRLSTGNLPGDSEANAEQHGLTIELEHWLGEPKTTESTVLHIKPEAITPHNGSGYEGNTFVAGAEHDHLYEYGTGEQAYSKMPFWSVIEKKYAGCRITKLEFAVAADGVDVRMPCTDGRRDCATVIANFIAKPSIFTAFVVGPESTEMIKE